MLKQNDYRGPFRVLTVEVYAQPSIGTDKAYRVSDRQANMLPRNNNFRLGMICHPVDTLFPGGCNMCTGLIHAFKENCMSRERKYQQGNFENYYPGRNAIDEEGYIRRDGGTDYAVRRRAAREVGGSPDPEGRPQPGSHRGKGPRNYQRRDERILEDINDRLCDNPYMDASEIDVSVSDGDVVFSGSVEDRKSKRLAEDIGDSVSGVKNVENRLRVRMRGI